MKTLAEIRESAEGRGERLHHHDIIAIGCGPFNLGLAALASKIDGLDLVVYEARPELRWHAGIMFDDAVLQLSFLADLVTLVDPTHPLSFLAYLRAADRMYPFFIREEFHPTRREYESYLRWAARQLSTLQFSHRVDGVEWSENWRAFLVSVTLPDGTRHTASAKNLVAGIGTEPWLPSALSQLPESRLLHSADYLFRKSDSSAAEHVTVIGSGQSGGEVMVDLLRRNLEGGPGVTWMTRTPAFAPLDYSKLVLEMTTPGYVRYFHGLSETTRDRLNAEQWQHYKGMSIATIAQIHDLLYQRELREGLAPVELRCGVSVEGATLTSSGQVRLSCRTRDTSTRFERHTSLVIAATGYRERPPRCLEGLSALLRRDARGRPKIGLDYALELDPSVSGRVFVANAELHSHGVATPDLGIGAYRNATILNAVSGREVYPLPKRTAFTSFDPPGAAAEREGATAERAKPFGFVRHLGAAVGG